MAYDVIVEVNKMDHIVEVEKFNPYHDARGRFATADGYASFTYAPGKSKAHDNAIAREKDRQNVQSRIAGMLGIDQSKIQLGDLPQKSKDSISRGVAMAMDKFPALKGKVTGIEYDENLEAYACADALTGKIKVGPEFKDYDKLVSQYRRGVNVAEFHVKGTDADSIIVHEIGHVLDGALTKSRVCGGKITKFGVIRSSSDMMDTVSSRAGLTQFGRQQREHYRSLGYKGDDLNHAVKFEKREWFCKNVSGYAAYNYREFFAECFTELVASKKPRNTAKIFGEELTKAMGEMK